jgi:hypothetical protein
MTKRYLALSGRIRQELSESAMRSPLAALTVKKKKSLCNAHQKRYTEVLFFLQSVVYPRTFSCCPPQHSPQTAIEAQNSTAFSNEQSRLQPEVR